MSESIKAAREFLLQNIPDQLDFALNPDTREMVHQVMTTFAQKVADEQTTDLRNRLERAEICLQKIQNGELTINEIWGLAMDAELTIKSALKELQEATK
jgi:hypothetical protein